MSLGSMALRKVRKQDHDRDVGRSTPGTLNPSDMSFRTGPLILVYNAYFDQWPDTFKLNCETTCRFTTDRGRLPEAGTVIFHLPTMRAEEYPQRPPGQRWVAWCMECRANIPELDAPTFMAQFDFTMGYWREATIWTAYFNTDTVNRLQAPPQAKTEASPLVYFQSSGLDHSGRVDFVRRLMGHMPVDSYGKVLNNRKLAGPDRGISTKLATIGRYRFTLALENSIDSDYVTEKFFQPLIAGSVPVYLGAPNVADFAPGEDSYIDIADFDGPESLASYLKQLCADEDAYARYLAWKSRPLRPQFLDLAKAIGGWSMYRLCGAVRGRDCAAGVPADGLSKLGRITSTPLVRSLLKPLRPLTHKLSALRGPGNRRAGG